MNECFSGRFTCVDGDADEVTLMELIPVEDAEAWQRRRWPDGVRFRQAQFHAVGFFPQIGTRFDLTFEMRPLTHRHGGAQLFQIVITSVSNITERH